MEPDKGLFADPLLKKIKAELKVSDKRYKEMSKELDSKFKGDGSLIHHLETRDRFLSVAKNGEELEILNVALGIYHCVQTYCR